MHIIASTFSVSHTKVIYINHRSQPASCHNPLSPHSHIRPVSHTTILPVLKRTTSNGIASPEHINAVARIQLLLRGVKLRLRQLYSPVLLSIQINILPMVKIYAIAYQVCLKSHTMHVYVIEDITPSRSFHPQH